MDAETFNKIKIYINDINALNRNIANCQRDINDCILHLSSLLLSLKSDERFKLKLSIINDILTLEHSLQNVDNL